MVWITQKIRIKSYFASILKTFVDLDLFAGTIAPSKEKIMKNFLNVLEREQNMLQNVTLNLHLSQSSVIGFQRIYADFLKRGLAVKEIRSRYCRVTNNRVFLNPLVKSTLKNKISEVLYSLLIAVTLAVSFIVKNAKYRPII